MPCGFWRVSWLVASQLTRRPSWKISSGVRGALDLGLPGAVLGDVKTYIDRLGEGTFFGVHTWPTLKGTVHQIRNDPVTEAEKKAFLDGCIGVGRPYLKLHLDSLLYGNLFKEALDCVTHAPRAVELDWCVEVLRENPGSDFLATIQDTSYYVYPLQSELAAGAEKRFEELLRNERCQVIVVEQCTVGEFWNDASPAHTAAEEHGTKAGYIRLDC